MEHQKMQHGEEIVLSYCPSDQAAEVELRYERELPGRMLDRPELPAAEKNILNAETQAENDFAAGKKTPRKHTGIKIAAIVLCFALAVGCVGAGVWGIADSVGNLLAMSLVIPDSLPDMGDSQDSGESGEEDNGDQGGGQTPGWGYREDAAEENTGAPQIETYRPVGDIPQLQLKRASSGRRTLTAGEVYEKVAPSTVTVLGVYETGYSVGTGVIFTSDGYIVTNYHVIAGCLQCEVWVTNEYGVDSTYPARFVGGDEQKDLAVLKIEREGLPAAEFGVSGDLSVGDTVYAIGNPLGTELRSTLTDGIVSAVDRTVDVDGVSMTLIQTNAALNSGNSGGPLVNAYGQVVGINTIKMMSSEDTIEGLGFAIPTSLAERWVNDILTLGEVRPSPVLGLSVNRIPVKLEDGTEGLEVLEVTRGLGAFRAGVEVGDVVVGFNGAVVSRVEDIYTQRLKLAVGDMAVIRVYRNGQYLDLNMPMMAAEE